MKYTFLLSMICFLLSCDSKTEVTPMPEYDYLWNLRRDANNAISDSFNKYSIKFRQAVAEGNNDSIYYYYGLSSAYYKCGNIVWPLYPNEYPKPSKK